MAALQFSWDNSITYVILMLALAPWKHESIKLAGKSKHRFKFRIIKYNSGASITLVKNVKKKKLKITIASVIRYGYTILSKNNKPRSITLPDFKLYYKAIVIKAVCHCHQLTHIKTEQTQSILICMVKWSSTGCQNTQQRKDSLFNK